MRGGRREREIGRRELEQIGAAKQEGERMRERTQDSSPLLKRGGGGGGLGEKKKTKVGNKTKTNQV